MSDHLHRLAERWKGDADRFEEWNPDGPVAGVLRRCAAQLEVALSERAAEAMTLQQAAEAGGYSPRHLRNLLADGTVPNIGRKGAPRIARGDVPMKPGHGTADDDFDVDAAARKLSRAHLRAS
jgi:hypothetical protein